MAGFGLGNYINPAVGGFIDQRRNALAGLGAGLLQGRPGAGVQEGIQADTAYAVMQREEAERQKAIADQAALRAKYAQQFIEWGKPDIAQAIADGIKDPGEAYWDHITPKAPIKASEGDVFLDPTTYKPVGGVPKLPDPKDAFAMEKDLAGQYGQQNPLKVYDDVKAGYERVRTSAAANNGAGDVGVVYGFMKMLDPGSVVREGEFATAEQTAGIPQQIVGLYNKLISGQRLTPEQRQQFVTMADGLYNEAAANLNEINTQFSTRAGAWNVDPNNFIRQPETFQPLQLPDYKAKYGLE